MTKPKKATKTVYKPMVCIYCRGGNHGRCPGCDCSQVKHVLEDVPWSA